MNATLIKNEKKRIPKRKSWDTAVKHYYRLGLEDNIPFELKKQIANSNKSRWKNESEHKYVGNEIAEFIHQEIELVKRIGQSSTIKKINESYFKLFDTFHGLISNIKGIKNVLKQQKELIVNTIEPLKDIIPINKALHVFNISRATYQNYKSIVIHKCEASYFKWCVKRHPNQLLIPEVDIIKKYMMHQDYKYWSKSSIYLKAIRDQKLSCGIATFYKYCRLLGFKNNTRKRKSDFYNPVRTNKPNELWCADVTIFKTKDNLKHYIHFLIDHFSKKILGYRIEKQNNPKAIKQLIQDAYFRYSPKKLQFLTDGGSENVNKTVSNFINSPSISIEHIIAQRDVAFSNSMIEATNKVIKHQFLFPKTIASRDELKPILYEAVNSYNSMRPQMSLAGNTPDEAFNGLSTDFSKYSSNFKEQKTVRRKLNKKNSCKKCS